MSFTGTVENGAINLPPGLHLPDGTKVEIKTVLPAVVERYADSRGIAEAEPRDSARNSDRVKRAISTLKSLRQGLVKPVGMTVRDLRETGRS